MEVSHVMASGMGGIRTAGDLVVRMQMTRKMRINEAKKYVAEKLKLKPLDLSDEQIMRELREELDIGIITGMPGCAKGHEAKARIANLLGVKINCIERVKSKAGLFA